jgi:hypothetical protein
VSGSVVYRGRVKFRVTIGVLSVVAGCAGATPGPTGPADENGAETRASAGGAKGRRSPRAARITCEDGSCFSCGETACLNGFYCAVTPRGRGCAWTPSCASRVTCDCLAATLRESPGCVCEEKAGGVYVSCDGAAL